MISHADIGDKQLRSQIRQQEICFAGNRQLKIYGLLQCPSGKRMKRGNRVFFKSEHEAIANHYRPCGNCMRKAYIQWKNGLI